MESVWLSYLQQTHGNRQSNTSRTEWSFALRDRPGVSLKLAEQVRQIHIDSVHGLKEPGYKQTHHTQLRQKNTNCHRVAKLVEFCC